MIIQVIFIYDNIFKYDNMPAFKVSFFLNPLLDKSGMRCTIRKLFLNRKVEQ